MFVFQFFCLQILIFASACLSYVQLMVHTEENMFKYVQLMVHTEENRFKLCAVDGPYRRNQIRIKSFKVAYFFVILWTYLPFFWRSCLSYLNYSSEDHILVYVFVILTSFSSVFFAMQNISSFYICRHYIYVYLTIILLNLHWKNNRKYTFI